MGQETFSCWKVARGPTVRIVDETWAVGRRRMAEDESIRAVETRCLGCVGEIRSCSDT